MLRVDSLLYGALKRLHVRRTPCGLHFRWLDGWSRRFDLMCVDAVLNTYGEPPQHTPQVVDALLLHLLLADARRLDDPSLLSSLAFLYHRFS